MTRPAVQCTLCPLDCRLAEGERGRCKVRICRGSALYSLVYAKPCAVHVDPIEKKPLYHFLPASEALSLATAGCCLTCKYCQNWEISQAYPEDTANLDFSPELLVKTALARGCRSIAYTYTEPTVFFEYMADTARLARESGLKNLFISCGFINPEPLSELCRWIDGANVAFKAFSDEFYMKISGGRLAPVLRTILALRDAGVHVELNHLLVPGQNDAPGEFEKLCGWILSNLGPAVPLHLPRFFPYYKFRNLSPAPVELLAAARRTALSEGLRHVYIGNVFEDEYNHTYCPSCGKRVIARNGYRLVEMKIDPGRSSCVYCGAKIEGVWQA